MQKATQRLGLIELTPAGRQEAARRLLVTAGLARRRHGFISADAARRRFLRHAHHTLGANAFFVDLAAAAMQVTSRGGGDDALVEWRSAAACARARFRPDGYGCYRRGPWRFGFFLEYDRGTERSGHYAAKLATYYWYRDSGAYTRDYQSFPTLLVVTTRAAAEARFAYQAYLAQEHHDAAPLTIFLTTTSRIAACPDGTLGRIWRSAAAPWAEPARVCWLPRLRRFAWIQAEPRLRVTDPQEARQSLETERVFGQTAVVSQQQSRGRSLITPS
jgi:Replication-relaxation